MIIRRIQTCADSKGLHLSEELLGQVGISIGDEVEIAIGKEHLVVEKKSASKYDFAELVTHLEVSYEQSRSVGAGLSERKSGSVPLGGTTLHQ